MRLGAPIGPEQLQLMHENSRQVANDYARSFGLMAGGGIAKTFPTTVTAGGVLNKIMDFAQKAAGVSGGAKPVEQAVAGEVVNPVPAGQLPIAKGNPYAGPRTPPNMEVAQSTNIGLHGYEPNSQTMLVQFKNGRVYEYRGVPQEIYDAYKTDPASQGSFFAQNIKGRYETNFRGTVKPTAGAQVRRALGK